MKRVLITAFAVLYTVALLLGASGRTFAWAADKIDAAEEKAQGPGVSASRNVTPHHPNRRILPNLFVVEPPVEASGIALVSAPHSLYFQPVAIRPQSGPPAPSRAPPQA